MTKQENELRIQRSNAYAEKVRKHFALCVNKILDLQKQTPKLDEGQMFSFATQSEQKQQEVEKLLRELHSVVTLAVQQGISLEWDKANKACDDLVKSTFGKKALKNPMFAGYLNRNIEARNTFIKRAENGLNLSQRVWKDVEQLKEQMEVAITVAIGEGKSASTMSREIRQYLDDPDLMFRRFRYKDDNGNWKKKWKKRVKDPITGKYKFIDYDRDSYKVGSGVYKSSAKNAMRLARTETNMAYRFADNERWQQMDFVLGQEVHLAHDHEKAMTSKDKKDICDKLAGVYPKDFKFTGWHPNCWCYVTSILAPYSEIQKMREARKQGKTYTFKGVVKDYPDNFKQWVNNNKNNILISRQNNTTPYFLKYNEDITDDLLGIKPKTLTPLQIAEKRHTNRTETQINDIKQRWEERQERIERNLGNKARKLIVTARKYKKEGIDATNLINAYQHSDELGLPKLQNEIKILARAIGVIKKRKTGLTDYTPHKALLKKYKTEEEINETFAKINSEFKGDKWFENGDLKIAEQEPQHRNNNGYTYNDGRIHLKQERLEKVKSALGKIGSKKAHKITKDEADAMATFWHETTHNRNKYGNIHLNDEQTRRMELANEFIARKTLPEFYGKLGVNNVPYKEFMTDRNTTSYNNKVKNYDFVISKLGLDMDKVVTAVKDQLFNHFYDTQETGLILGLQKGGIKHIDNTPLSKKELKDLIKRCVEEGQTSVEWFLKYHKILQ